jgi:hypothetical protein
MSLGAADDRRKAIGGLIAQIGDVDDVDCKSLVAKILYLQVRVRAAEGENRGVAFVGGEEDGRPGRSAFVADDPPVGNAFLCKARQDRFGAPVLANFRQDGNIEADARHGDGGVDRPAAGVRRNVFRFRLAAFLEQQEGAVGMMQRQALDTLALDYRNRIHHGAADGQDSHSLSDKSKPPAAAHPVAGRGQRWRLLSTSIWCGLRLVAISRSRRGKPCAPRQPCRDHPRTPRPVAVGPRESRPRYWLE